MRLPTTIAALVLSAGIAHAQATAFRPALTNTDDWNIIRADGCGLACSENEIREATGIPKGLKQNHPGWLNSSDAYHWGSLRFAPKHGIRVLRGHMIDAQDFGRTKVTVKNYMGTEVLKTFYPYKGRKANGEYASWTFRAKDVGQTGLRGVTIEYETEKLRGELQKNGVSFTHEYRADPACMPKRGEIQSADRAEAKRGDKGNRGKSRDNGKRR